MTTEWPVWAALRDVLSPLCAYGFRFDRCGDDVLVQVEGRTLIISARDLIDSGDPCAHVAEAVGL